MASRKGSRKSRRATRKGRRRASRHSRRASRRCWSGGAATPLNPADASWDDSRGPSQLNLAQGRQYGMLHAAQHGGAAVELGGAPVGYTGVLDQGLRASAGVDVTDRANAAIVGLSDQSGGGRRRRGRKSRKGRKASRKARKGRKAGRKSRRSSRRGSRRLMYGGASTPLTPADYSSPGLLLPSDLEAKALGTMNPEWKLAADPTSFAPKL